MACGSCGAKARAVGGGLVTGYRITYRDGRTEDVPGTDLSVVRKKITLGGGGTYKALTSKG